VAAVNAAPVYGDYAAAAEQYAYDNAWHPSHLPAFDTAEQSAEEAYQEETYYQQDKVIPVPERSTYGAGFPHRLPWMDVNNATVATVRNVSDEWWVPVHFPKADYLLKVDTGVRVNVILAADLSRLGYRVGDLLHTTVFLVGFNKAVDCRTASWSSQSTN
jgi:hypothetical protein